MEYRKHRLRDVTRSQLNSIIDECIIGFKAERNRAIMKDRLCNGKTFEELSEIYDMSVNQIKNIVYRELDIITRYLEIEV